MTGMLSAVPFLSGNPFVQVGVPLSGSGTPNADVSHMVVNGTLVTNSALNPRAVQLGSQAEYIPRWGWAVEWHIGLGAPVDTFVRLLVGTASVGGSRGFDQYINMDTAPVSTGNAVAHPVKAGVPVVMSVLVAPTKTAPVSLLMRAHDGSVWLGAASGATVTVQANTWTLATFTYTPPADGFLSSRVAVDSTGWTSTDSLNMTELSYQPGSGPYFDGSFPGAWWGDGGLDPSIVRVQVRRTVEGRTFDVRQGNVTPGSAVTDFEAPFGVPSTYAAELFDSNGISQGFTPGTTITVNYQGTVVHQPLDPTLYVKPAILSDTAASLVGARDGGPVWPDGAATARWSGSRRRMLTATDIALMLTSRADADLFQAMLGDYTTPMPGVLCVRTSDRVRRWPATFFCAGVWAESRLGVEDVFQLSSTVAEVDPPVPGLAVPFLSYDDIDASYPSYTAMDAAYQSYTDMDRDYSLAGAAG